MGRSLSEGYEMTEHGQYRLDLAKNRMVELIHTYSVTDFLGERVAGWWVRDLLSKDTYECEQRHIGHTTYNEMEVLAWATK